MSSIIPQLGVKMNSDDAKAFVAALNGKVIQRWEERVTKGPFMSRFIEGQLPIPAIKLFFKNWGNFTVEITDADARTLEIAENGDVLFREDHDDVAVAQLKRVAVERRRDSPRAAEQQRH